MNFVALVECTHLVGSRKVSPGDAEKFKKAYNKYTLTSKVLDPDCSIKPNHHYAKHIGSQLEWWGPLLGVAEFAGERLCGFMQKINTNGKVEEMAQTMMKWFCHLQRLFSHQFAKDKDAELRAQRNIGGLFGMDDDTYSMLLKYQQAKDATWVDYRQPPYASGSRVLGAAVRELMGLEGQGGFRFSKAESHNIVKCAVDGNVIWGQVLHIISLEQSKDIVVMVRNLEIIHDPALDGIFKQAGIVWLQQSAHLQFLLPSAVVSTASYRKLAGGKLGARVKTWMVIAVGGLEDIGAMSRDLDVMYGNVGAGNQADSGPGDMEVDDFL
ncbi:hypothetical protein CROQUDRAFT_38811 [Cronartium quercuum f. sp. fusiforme G11]|uniref:Uncharacterized protein n=1 Tax=Cronartium quercuum f. sp. fusiforme G11 TaxID=708437 RepID=A0A9P6TFN8_9BASI|nr:hypothetical protein CROQUDRAFT_38811 [Cronartium quercuum f. sp. fusiforme G11]